MLRTGSLVFLFLLQSLLANCQVEFEAFSNKESYARNERFEIGFKVNAQGSGFRPPSLDMFKVRSGPNISTSMTMVNGEMTSTTTNTYVLEPLDTGTFTIGSALIVVDGKEYHSDPIIIKIRPDSVETHSTGRAVIDDDGNAFVRVELNETKIGFEDIVVARYLLFSSYKKVLSMNEYNIPVPEDVWVETLSDDRTNVVAFNRSVNGKNYNVYELQTSMIQPMKTGKVVLEPFSISINVRLKTKGGDSKSNSIFSQFFGGDNYLDSVIRLRSEPVVLEVVDAKHIGPTMVSREDFMSLMNKKVVERSGVPGSQTVILADVSASMECDDLKPDRLEAVKKLLLQLVKQNEGAMLGLIPFSNITSDSGLETSDMTAFVERIEAMEYSTRMDGTSIGMALYMAVKRLEGRQGEQSILLLSDGNTNTGNVSALTAARLAAKYGIKVHIVGLGIDGEAVCATDSSGQKVLALRNTGVNEPLLKEIATITNGAYYRAKSNAELKKLVAILSKELFR